MKKIKELKKQKALFIIVGFILITLVILQSKAYAALQSNPNTHYNESYQKGATTWMNEIRKMEEPDNAMGLKEELNADLTTKTGTNSNNIDVHMMRNTEYGAIAILAVSGYGNSATMQESTIKTTTGNVTGVYYTTTGKGDIAHAEFVAGGLSDIIFSGKNTRYYDEYSNVSGENRIGDAMNLKWQNAEFANWATSKNLYFARNLGGYFSFGAGTINHTNFSRGVAVCGTGL